MTDYTAITELETNPGAPGTSSLWKRWWKNPLAMFEGAVGAPRLQFAALDAAFSTAGEIGSFVLARRNTTGNIAYGATVAGSTLTPTSVLSSLSFPANSGTYTMPVAAALSGTWRCMGQYSHTAYSAPTLGGATLWIRIA